jgi:hypothetical protein
MRKEALRAFFLALDAGKTKTEANRLARAEWERLFAEPCTDRTVRRWAALIERRGGFEFAPDVAYCDEKSCDHNNARIDRKLTRKLGIDGEALDALIAEARVRATNPGMEHLRAVHRSLEMDWIMGRPVPGLGSRAGDAPFPVSHTQLRVFLPSTAARRAGSHGEARLARECAPWIHQSTASIRPLELLVLDDTRIDIVATADRTGRLVELKAYILMDVASRKILGWVVKDGAIGKEDVACLLARVLRAYGLPVAYQCHIIFERGAVACSDAAETLLRSIWPDRVFVHRTSMDGGKSAVAGFWQSQSGHWMGKGWIESFMRTLAFYLQHIPGQRGGDYRRQPAMLGLKGREHGSGALLYDRGHGGASTQMHEAALTSYAELSLSWIEAGTISNPQTRLKARALMPRRWVQDRIGEAIFYYNTQTDHRRGGFATVEFQDKQTGALRSRAESSDERFFALSSKWPAERINPADAARLLHIRARTVTVDARSGVTFDHAPFKGLRFWRPDSLACHQAAQLATLAKKMVALFDADALRQWRPGVDRWTPEIHLIAGAVEDADWHPGAQGRYLETLPLYGDADRLDAQAMAAAAADKASVLRRIKTELVQAAGPRIARQLADLADDESRLAGVVSQLQLDRAQMENPSALFDAMREGPATRREAVDPAARRLAEFQQAALAGAPAAPEADQEPEVF